ncbi:hypothetical protein PGT21_020233 [Puccinia graminis f. sp. tritici]|uniref:Uncharacterized protein n=1 Tax=Puccinia graminis f. sp. tritici TaxID=56615 RepID=A0A5B0RFU0_PUCGR|nr:hypothetical protein PGT21_020233 [Puccinia graminis f. sp. tritici]KAA1124577.1 hypothetical protein PGTUg99_018543 [Puccinia graminis f. sp. tritici]
MPRLRKPVYVLIYGTNPTRGHRLGYKPLRLFSLKPLTEEPAGQRRQPNGHVDGSWRHKKIWFVIVKNMMIGDRTCESPVLLSAAEKSIHLIKTRAQLTLNAEYNPVASGSAAALCKLTPVKTNHLLIEGRFAPVWHQAL